MGERQLLAESALARLERLVLRILVAAVCLLISASLLGIIEMLRLLFR